MATLLYRVRSLVLWALWLVLVIVWFATLWAKWQEREVVAVLLAGVVLGLLAILYYAEGLELAATDLLDKQPEQMRSVGATEVLKEIQARPGFFYAHRQVFVVTIISFTSLVTSYAWVNVPFVGKVSAYGVPFWFSLLFTTLTVLWFCQVTPKRLAVLNSELFLVQSRFVWRLIRITSLLGLPDPSDWLVVLAQKRSHYRTTRHLLPSRAAHYSLTTRLQGFSTDKIRTRLIVADDGSAAIIKRFMVLFLHGAHGQMYGELDTVSRFTIIPEVRLIGLYRLVLPEELQAIANRLDTLFESGGECAGEPNVIANWAHRVDVDVVASDGLAGERAVWTIEGERLPERFWSHEDDPNVGRPLLALVYEVEASVDSGAFRINSAVDNEWAETMALPCRQYSMSVVTAPESGLAVVAQRVTASLFGSGTDWPEEAEKYSLLAVAQRGALEIPYPLQGGTYTLFWRLFPKETQCAAPPALRSPSEVVTAQA